MQAVKKTAAPELSVELIAIYCAAWSEPDAARRLELLERVWDENGTYTDPSVHVDGRAALADHIAGVMRKYPGATVAPTSIADAHHGRLRFAWQMTLSNGEKLPEGTDIAELSIDGKFRRIVGFFGKLKAA
jgi:SnoaL-like domain